MLQCQNYSESSKYNIQILTNDNLILILVYTHIKKSTTLSYMKV